MSALAMQIAKILGQITGLFLSGLALGAGVAAGVHLMGWLL